MRRSLIAALIVAAVAMAFAAPASAKSENAAAAEARARAAERDAVRAYWTPERRAKAIPRDIILPLGTAAPKAKPVKPGGSTSSGASWTAGGSVAETTGKVFFTLNGSNYVCSGSAVQGNGVNIVSTAGHCVHEGDGLGQGGYATRWAFYPGYQQGDRTASPGFVAEEIVATTNWQKSGAAHGAYPDDAAFVRVDGGPNDNIGFTSLGTLPTVGFSSVTSGTHHSFGYPAAGKYNGQVLTYCAGDVRLGYYDRNYTISMVCDMTGGSSGGPWFSNFVNGAVNTQTSVNSYGYSGQKRMWGPVFDGAGSTSSNEKQAYEAANTTTMEAISGSGTSS